MRTYWKWASRRGQVLRLPRVIRCWRLARDRCGLSPEQTRLLLKGSALEEDVNCAERTYNAEELESNRKRGGTYEGTFQATSPAQAQAKPRRNP